MKIAIVGTSGSGKTTLAKKLSEVLGCIHIEQDAYAWSPGWIKKDDEKILGEVKEALKAPSWVICGNYSLTRDIAWKEATHVIWLAFPFRIILWRLLKRTIRNILTKKEIAGGNKESFYMQFFTKKSIFVWAIQTHSKRKKTYNLLLKSGEYDSSKILVLKRPRQVDELIVKELFKKSGTSSLALSADKQAASR